MKRLVLVLVAACALLAPAVASAHPLGNFTINKFARVEVSGHRLYVRYVVDMAEIPTLQRVPVRIGGLHVTVSGRPVTLRVTRTALAHPRGAAGLHTTRFQAILVGPAVAGPVRVTVDDRNYADRIGWKEIVFGAQTKSLSDELRAYPKDMLRSPLSQVRASATLRTASTDHNQSGWSRTVDFVSSGVTSASYVFATCAMSAMSSFRSRKGGSVIVNTLRR